MEELDRQEIGKHVIVAERGRHCGRNVWRLRHESRGDCVDYSDPGSMYEAYASLAAMEPWAVDAWLSFRAPIAAEK